VVVVRQFRPWRRVELGEKGTAAPGDRKGKRDSGKKGDEVGDRRSRRGAGVHLSGRSRCAGNVKNICIRKDPN
jgi:hypothetical protein